MCVVTCSLGVATDAVCVCAGCMAVWLALQHPLIQLPITTRVLSYNAALLMCRHGKYQHQMHCRTLVQHQEQSICSNTVAACMRRALQLMPNAVNSQHTGKKTNKTHSTAMMTRIGVSVRRGNAAMQDAMWPNRPSFSAGSMPS